MNHIDISGYVSFFYQCNVKSLGQILKKVLSDKLYKDEIRFLKNSIQSLGLVLKLKADITIRFNMIHNLYYNLFFFAMIRDKLINFPVFPDNREKL